MKILILGGYGIFGGRLARLVSGDDRLHLFIAGRSLEKAKAFCESLPPGAHRSPVVFDRDGDVDKQLEEIKPDLVIDGTGPFQIYKGDPYAVVKSCIANQINYMDFADGSGFVKGVSQFDKQAKDKNIFILSGVSSFPVLSAAVVRKLSVGVKKINSIRAGIAPSPYAIVGLNVIRAITAYAGKPIQRRKGGKIIYSHALTETTRYTVKPPGYIPVKNTVFSLVDVPDLQVLPEIWTDLDEIWIGAGPTPEILHRMLIGLSWLVKLKIIPSLLPFASLFHFVINHLRWGEHRGGMFVEIQGLSEDDENITRSWHMLAEGDSGPFIPSMGLEAIILKMLSGEKPESGSRPATMDLELEDYDEMFKDWNIFHGVRDSRDETHPYLYRRLLGNAWETLPESIRAMHLASLAEGVADVERGRNIFARIMSQLMGFPDPGTSIPVKVEFIKRDGGELWKRTFGNAKFSSFQKQGTGKYDGLLMEQFGPFQFGIALVVEGERLRLVPRYWNFLGIRLPLALAPQTETYEHENNGRFHFYVEIRHKLVGLIIRYQGYLQPA